MDILPTEEEDMVRNMAREFLEGECPTSLVRAMEKDDQGYPPELWKKMVELGWPAISLPEQYGGQGMPLIYLGIILEEVGRAMAPVPLHSTMVAALTVAADGSAALKQAVLPVVPTGDLIMSWPCHGRVARLQPGGIGGAVNPHPRQVAVIDLDPPEHALGEDQAAGTFGILAGRSLGANGPGEESIPVHP